MLISSQGKQVGWVQREEISRKEWGGQNVFVGGMREGKKRGFISEREKGSCSAASEIKGARKLPETRS